jgi:hypothetical protein
MGVQSGDGAFSLIQPTFDEPVTSYRLTLTGSTNPVITAGSDCELEITSLGNHFELTRVTGGYTLQSDVMEFAARYVNDVLTGLLSVSGAASEANVTLMYGNESTSCTFNFGTLLLSCP